MGWHCDSVEYLLSLFVFLGNSVEIFARAAYKEIGRRLKNIEQTTITTNLLRVKSDMGLRTKKENIYMLILKTYCALSSDQLSRVGLPVGNMS